VAGRNPGESVNPDGLDVDFLLANGFIHEAANPSKSEAKAEATNPKEN
jgi:hypothetical protein